MAEGTQTVAEVIAKGARPAQLRVIAEVALAVARVHAAQGVAGGLAPATIAIGELGSVTLPAAATAVAGYAAPELAHGGAPTAAADVYALGAVLFELLAGQPLQARTADGAAAIGEPRPARRAPDADVPGELDDLAARALAADPAARPSARELARAIHAYLDGDREAVRRAALATAAELVSRVITEPPGATPPALAAAIAADRLATVRRMSRAVSYAYGAYLLFAPAFLWLGAGQPGSALALTIIVGINLALLARQGFTSARPRAPLVAIGNAILLAMIARLWSPFLAAPGLAAITVMVSAMSPIYVQRRWVAAMAAAMALAIVGPFFLELAGVLDTTMQATPGRGLELFPPGLHLTVTGQYLIAVMYVVALVAASATVGYTIRGGERSLRERLLRIAWQLRQLAPGRSS